jgi:proliferating cell nuclear antigen
MTETEQVKKEEEPEEQEVEHDEEVQEPDQEEDLLQEPDWTNGEFKLKLENSKVFKTMVSTLSSIVDETELMISPDQLQIKAMDPSRICLLKIEMQNEDFDEYECEQYVKVPVNLDDLEKIMKRSTSNDSITLVHEAQDNKLKIVMEMEGTSRKRTFSLALLDLESEEIPLDNLLQINYPSLWTIDPDFFIEAIKDAEIYSEILSIQAEEGRGLRFKSSGQIGEMEYTLGIEDLIDITVTEDSNGNYSLVFLKSIMGLDSITEKLEISLKTDHPLKMIFNLLEGAEVSYFLAPRVEETTSNEDDMEEF